MAEPQPLPPRPSSAPRRRRTSDRRASEERVSTEEIEASLGQWRVPVPAPLWPEYLNYQYEHSRPFVMSVSLIGWVLYAVFAVPDAMFLPDMLQAILSARAAVLLIGAGVFAWLFRSVRDVRVWDGALMGLLLLGAAVWFGLLVSSAAAPPNGYLYAACVFLLWVPLAVQSRFWIPVAASSLVTLATAVVAAVLEPERPWRALVEFAWVFLPLLPFTLQFAWANLRNARRGFLRQTLDERARGNLLDEQRRLLLQVQPDALIPSRDRGTVRALAQSYWDRVSDGHRDFGLLIVDVDHYQHYRDSHGSEAGALLLERVHACLQQALRMQAGAPHRAHCEEFVVMLADVDRDGLALVAQRLVERVDALAIEHAGRPDGRDRVTISVGASLSSFVEPGATSMLLRRADVMLYAAKRRGRGRASLDSGGVVVALAQR